MAISDHPSDVLNECVQKLAFLSCCFNHTHPDCTVELYPSAIDGLFLLLTEIEADLRHAAPQLVYKPSEEV